MNINKIVAVGLCAVVFGIMPTIANAQYDDAVYGGDFDWGSSYDYSGYDNAVYGGDFDWGSSYDYSGYDNAVYGGDVDWGSSYDYSGYDNAVYGGDVDWGTSYDPYSYDNAVYGGDFDWGTNFGASEYEYNPNGATEYEYNPNGATEYEYNPNCVGCATEYEYNPNGATEYEYNPGCGTGCATEYEYNPGCGCYQSTYGGSYGGGYGGSGGGFKMPSFGGMTIMPPSYTPPRPTPTPTYPQPTPPRPTPTTPSTPININNTNTNTNTNVNTNVTTVTPVTPGPIVQYVYPYSQQYPTYYPTYPAQSAYCVITASSQYGYGNGTITLTWSSQGASSAYITPGLGQVAPNGSTTLYGYSNTVYTMTVSGPNGSYTCHTQSYVNPITPVSPYVSLTQIPYTGLALGPIGNALYWMGLISVAVAGAYLLVYYKGGMLALATSVVSRSQEDEVSPEEAPKQEEVAALAHLPVQESTTRDAMKIVRSEDGTPRLVISRA